MLKYLVAFLLAATAAEAGCIVDDKKASTVATIIAATRVCTGMKAAPDEHITRLYAAFNAIVRDEREQPACITQTIMHASGRWGALAGASDQDKASVCSTLMRAIQSSTGMRAMLGQYVR